MHTARLLTVLGGGVSGVFVCPGVSRGCVHIPTQTQRHTLRGDPEADTPPVDRQTPVKTLPCPKLSLREVNITF